MSGFSVSTSESKQDASSRAFQQPRKDKVIMEEAEIRNAR